MRRFDGYLQSMRLLEHFPANQTLVGRFTMDETLVRVEGPLAGRHMATLLTGLGLGSMEEHVAGERLGVLQPNQKEMDIIDGTLKTRFG